MTRPRALPLVEWSPILNVGFLTIPVCAGLLGGWFHLPLLAVALCVPQSGYIGWFYRQIGAVAIGLSALVAWWLPYVMAPGRRGDFDVAEAMIGPIIIFLFAALNARLRSTVDQAQQWADTDALTGLLNRSGLERRLYAESNRGSRTQTPVSVAFLDCDHFKQFNDTHGHAAGDQLLIELAQLLQSSVRNYDAVARLGGDEFALLLPGADVEGTRSVLSRLQSRMQELAVARNWSISWSIGAVVFPEPADPAAMIAAADRLMYTVKRQGKGNTLVEEHAPALEPASPV